MFRLKKLLWILIVLWIVFFIICDEKWYKLWFENNHIVLNEPEKKSELVVEEDPFKEVVYKNSDWIHINYEFENPKTLRKADWIDTEYLAKIEEEKRLEQERIEEEKRLEKERLEEEKLREQERAKKLALKDEDTISSVFQWRETQDNTWTTKPEIASKPEVKQNTWTVKPEVKQNTWTAKPEVKQNTWTVKPEEVKTIVYYPVKKYEHNKNILDLSIWAEPKKYKVEKYQRNELALNLCEWKVSEPKILYKNSNRIKLYTWFENPRNMLSSAGIDEESLAKKENKKSTSWDNSDTISSALQNKPNTNENITNTWDSDIEIGVSEIEEDINTWVNDVIESGNIVETWTIILWTDEENWKEPEVVLVKVDKYQHNKHSLDLYEWKIPEVILVKVDKYQHNKHSLDLYEWKIPEPTLLQVDKFEHEDHTLDLNEWKEPEIVLVKVDKYQHNKHNLELYEWKIPEVVLVKVDKYQHTKYNLELYEWKAVEHNFIVDNTTENIEPTENWLSDSLMDSLLEDEEINIDTLESENDEFLQKVFEKTRDRDVMNLIVETYLNEYQFVKAKKFIEELPEMYLEELKPSLHLRVVFNSFPLSSKNINENLNSVLQDYINRGLIMDEDKNRYLWVLALMDRNYDKFFEIAAQFTSEKNKAFASKLQWYKDQISKQMWMPQYYFDTLVSLELFNQWLFQPSKVLALYSLQQNANYILPHQVLAYANFLTNSRDTSVEYFKKLVDLDPNNAEKYRFLMWVASYRDEKYEQSVVMLSMIKDEKLRLDTQRYLINDYLKLDQKNKLISNRNKMLWYENLVASDFYTYFYETFFRPYSQWEDFLLYALDTELANKMLRVCSMTLQDEEKAVCTYGTIGRNIAMWQFDWMEQYLLNLVAEYPQWYLYQALWEYYVKLWELDKAKAYLLKAVSLTQKRTELSQIKKLLQQTI